VQIAVELLPEAFKTARLRIEYKAPAKLGEPLYPERILTEGALFLLLSDREGKPYTIMEFDSPKAGAF
jgi:hypothetical protein